MSMLLQFASFYNRQEVFVWSNYLLDLGIEFGMLAVIHNAVHVSMF